MCTSLLKTLDIEYVSNPCVERVLALGGGVILYSKAFQSYFRINCHSTELGKRVIRRHCGLDPQSHKLVVLTTNTTFPSPLGEVAFVLAEQATNAGEGAISKSNKCDSSDLVKMTARWRCKKW